MKRRAARPGPWRIMHPVRGQIRVAMGLTALGAMLNLGALLALAGAASGLTATPGQWPAAPLALAAACVAGSYLMRLAAFGQSHRAAFRLEALLRHQLAAHLGRVPLGEIQRWGAGALSKVMQDDVKALHVLVADSTPLHARAFVMPACAGFVLLWLDWRLALAAAAVLVVGFGGLGLATRGAADMGRQYNAARERVSAAVVEFVQAMPVVRSFDTGQATFGRYRAALDGYLDVLTRWYRQAGFSARTSFALLNPLPSLLILLWLGAWLITSGQLDFDTWVCTLLFGAGMAEAMMPMMMLRQMVEKAGASVDRIEEVLALPVQAWPTNGRLPGDASVVFDKVCFGYDGNAALDGGSADDGAHRLALSDVSFRADAGTVTALVGPSGAGKSTVAQLIPRFRDVSAGRVLVGGMDVREMAPDVLMAQVGFVFQDSFLFADSIASNIRLGSPEADRDAVIAAASAAQAHDFITQLPQGYDTPIGERGARLSGGQRQRIAIARAILQNRPVLVLDEATAFADPENERALLRALAALMHGKTTIIVAHRLASVRNADQILVLEGGRVVEAGRHPDLVAHGGTYARLWACHERAQRWTPGSDPGVADPTILPERPS